VTGAGNLLLAVAFPQTLKSVGFAFVLSGLVAEAIVILLVSSGTVEKSLSVLCTVTIALGVWMEEVGGNAFATSRQLTLEQQLSIGKKLSRWSKISERQYQEAVVFASPDSFEARTLTNNILGALEASNWITHRYPEVSLDRVVVGVGPFAPREETRASAVIAALARVLKEEGITAEELDARRPNCVQPELTGGESDPACSRTIYIVVGVHP
jgi:hypothetical protein